MAETLDLLAQIVGGDDTSRLYRLLEERKLASSAGSDYVGAMLDGGRLAFIVEPFAGVSLSKVEAALDEVVATVQETSVTKDELARAKSALKARSIFVRDDLLTLARLYGEAVAVGRSIVDVDNLPGRIEHVTVDDIQRAAREYLKPANSVTGTIVSPDNAKGPTARAAKQ